MPCTAGDITSLLGKTLAYDTAGRLSQATGVPPCPGGVNCSGLQTTTSRYNGWGQRFLRENELEQSVFSYGLEGFTLLSQTTRRLATAQQSTTEHIWLPTASGQMPVAVVIDGVHYAVHADHLNTPRRLSDASGQTRWQWPYSGFGEIAPQATPAAGQAPVSFALRYPGQIDDGNELFYNWHRFYEPRVGRYTKADPIGLEGGWNRFGYVDASPLMNTDPLGLWAWGDPLPQGAINACAGFGDGVSLGLTGGIRELMGTNDSIDFSSPEYLGGAVAGLAVTTRGYATGAELSIGRNFRLAPWGNRTGNPTGRYPHYHRRGAPDANGNTPPGQGIGRHRPWDKKSTDKCVCDRF